MTRSDTESVSLMWNAHWQTKPQCNGDPDLFIIKAQTTGGDRECEQPVPTVGEPYGLEGSSLCERYNIVIIIRPIIITEETDRICCHILPSCSLL